MNTAGWAVVIALGWLVLGAVVGYIVGRVIRNRDRQIPRPPHVEPEQSIRSANRSPRKRHQVWPLRRKR